MSAMAPYESAAIRGATFCCAAETNAHFSTEDVGRMSTGRVALLALLVGCKSHKAADPPPGPCVPAPSIQAGSGAGAVEGTEATVCFGETCVRLDRNGKTISAAVPISPPAPQVQQDRQVGGGRVATRDAA